VLVVLPRLEGSEIMKAKIVLLIIIICQYVPRLLRIIPLYLQITRSAGILTETAWAGAAFNLIIYMLASHVSPLNILLARKHYLVFALAH
jgi:cyclic nucleotide gated channel, plant